MGTNPGTQFDHELWLTMRRAYTRYQRVLEAKDKVALMPLDGGFSPEHGVGNEAAVLAEQLDAFENYIEARLALSEFMVSQREGPAIENDSLQEDKGGRRYFRIPRSLALAAAVMFLLPAALGFANLVWERKQVRDLEAIRTETNLALAQMRSQVAAHSQITKGPDAASQPALAGSPATAPTPANRPPRINRTGPRSPDRGESIGRNRQLQKPGQRGYYAFLLTGSESTKRIGRVRLAIRKVVPKHHYSELLIAVDNLAPVRKRVTLDQPVWIGWKGQSKAVELVVNRIDQGGVGGYVSGPKYPPTGWRPASAHSFGILLVTRHRAVSASI
jgi:hypothetical protein